VKRTAASRQSHQKGPHDPKVIDCTANYLMLSVVSASGNTKIEKQRAEGEEVRAIFSRGKNLLIKFRDFSIRIHFLMYGSYRIDEDREGMSPRLSLVFESGFVNFYNCSVKILRNEEIEVQVCLNPQPPLILKG
jgi:endonuclease-8